MDKGAQNSSRFSASKQNLLQIMLAARWTDSEHEDEVLYTKHITNNTQMINQTKYMFKKKWTRTGRVRGTTGTYYYTFSKLVQHTDFTAAYI